MYKNTAGTLKVFAFNRVSNVPVLGNAANITCRYSLDGAASLPIADLNPVELEDGYYLFDVTATETNGITVDFYPESTTPNVQVIAADHNRYTVLPSINITPEVFDNLDSSLVAGNVFVHYNNELRTYTITLINGTFDGQAMKFILNNEDGFTVYEKSPIISNTNTAIVEFGPVNLLPEKCGSWSLRRISDGFIYVGGPAKQRAIAKANYP